MVGKSYVTARLETLADRTGLIRQSMHRQGKELEFKSRQAMLHFASALNAMVTAEEEMNRAAREESSSE